MQVRIALWDADLAVMALQSWGVLLGILGGFSARLRRLTVCHAPLIKFTTHKLLAICIVSGKTPSLGYPRGQALPSRGQSQGIEYHDHKLGSCGESYPTRRADVGSLRS